MKTVRSKRVKIEKGAVDWIIIPLLVICLRP